MPSCSTTYGPRSQFKKIIYADLVSCKALKKLTDENQDLLDNVRPSIETSKAGQPNGLLYEYPLLCALSMVRAAFAALTDELTY